MKIAEKSRQAGAKAWFVWSLSAVAFGYAFFQRVAPSVMVSDLMSEFSIGAAMTGYLSALYFYPYVALQFPLGAMLDRFGVRALLAFAVGLAAAGSLLFGSAQSIEQAYVGRVMIGCGSAVGFLSSLRLAANWFPAPRFAFLAGLVMLFGMISGIGGQAPLAWLISQTGWRDAMFAAGMFAAALCLLIAIFVRDAPAGAKIHLADKTQNWSAILNALKDALSRREVWLIALVATTMTGPMLAFGGLWGVPYIMGEYQLERPEAALYVSMMLFGWAAGAPTAGWLSDRIRRRKAPMVYAAIAQAALMAAIACLPGIPLGLMIAMMFLIGMMGAAMAITFALAREVTDPAIHGSVSGIVNAMTVASGAILQPIIG
ncbi:MAG: MFS transporter, partial [Aestuariivirgaceae bacterium]